MSPLFACYYERLLRFCIDEGIQVRLVKLPVNQPVTHTQQYVDEYHAFSDSLLKRFPSVTLLWVQEGFDQHEIDNAMNRARGKPVHDLAAYIRRTIENERKQGKRILPAQDFTQRDYSGVQDELMQQLAADMEQFKEEQQEGNK